MRSIWGLCAAGAMLVLAGCGSNTTQDQNAAGGSGTAPSGGGATTSGLTGAGATFPQPIYEKWMTSYKSDFGIQINYQGGGSGKGIKALKDKTVDFGASDAPLTAEEEKDMPGPVLHIPTVGGAVAVVYNVPEVTGHLKLTGDVVAKMFLGTIKTWNDPAIAALNAGAKLPATPVQVVHRAESSGTTNVFTSYLKAASPDWAKVGAGKSVNWPVGVGGKGNDGVAEAVKQQPGGIGYVELAYALHNKMSYAALRNADGAVVEPTVESISAAIAASLPALKKDVRTPIINAKGAKSYPISSLTYVLVYAKPDSPEKGRNLAEFLKWALDKDRQAMAKEMNYAPLPDPIVEINLKALDGLVQ